MSNPNTTQRKGERLEAQNRSSRLFEHDDYWYFRTREGMEIGPFDYKMDAEQGIDNFIDFVSKTEPEVITKISQYVTAA